MLPHDAQMRFDAVKGLRDQAKQLERALGVIGLFELRGFVWLVSMHRKLDLPRGLSFSWGRLRRQFFFSGHPRR